MKRFSLLAMLTVMFATFPLVADAVKPWKVFILAGQSNMEGQAVVDLDGKNYNDGKGTLATLMKDPNKAGLFKHLKDDQGNWTVRNDVWVRYQTEDSPLRKGPLGVGFAVYNDKHHFGPELQFGHVMGDHFENPVLLIKTAWGGKSLYQDFRPPGSGGKVGPYYTKMLAEIREALANLNTDFPAYQGAGYELAGFVWYHGWNDSCDLQHAAPEYEQNLVHLIQDVRKDLGAPKLPFIIGELTGPWVEVPDAPAMVRKAQAAASARPEFQGNVLFVETHDFVRKPEESPNPSHGHHEFGNAETYFLVGDALGKGMVRLLDAKAMAGHQARRVEGWTVYVSDALLKTEAAATENALALLQQQLAEIVRVVPADAVLKLREVPLWFNPEYPGVPPRAEYHPDAAWLRDNGRNTAMAQAVEFTNVRIFEKETKRMPNFALHELAHAFHDRVLGFDQAAIIAAYERAKASNSYENVERSSGDGRPNRRERSYAMTNDKEYFAECTEAFFLRNDFFPFVRADLHRHDPHMDQVLERVWGVAADKAKEAPNGKAAKRSDTPTVTAGPQPLRGLNEVPHEQVTLSGGFWGPKLKINSEVTIPHALDELEKDGHVTNFDKAAGRFDGPLKGHHAFDSDLHKTLEGAMIALKHNSNKGLRQRVDGIVDRILAAQQKDGFLISCYIVRDQDKRWDDLRLEHQMYNAGHFFEMAVEHNRLTGDPKALNAAKRFADHIDGVFGPNKRYDVDGHQEVELALVKLYRATGERRYLDLSRFFLDERGYQHGTERKPLDPKTNLPPRKPDEPMTPEQRRAYFRATLRWRNGRMQDHKPIVEQHEAVGHAVRAGYMYAGMADIVRFSDAPGYEHSLDAIFDDVVSRKLYVNGGVGTGQYDDEGFGDPYRLPNESAYCESCAAIANVLWQHRMALLKADAKHADMMELSLYNAVLSGVSLSGDRFCYQNPLAHRMGRERKPWIGLSCCPTNLSRIIPQVGGLAYAQGKGRIMVNLYAAGEAKVKMADGAAVTLTQQTEYPWNGGVRLSVGAEPASEFDLCLRIPGWAKGRPVPSDLYRFADGQPPEIKLKINGTKVSSMPGRDGYVHLQRRWQAGDAVELDLPMPVQRVWAHEKVEENEGKVALMRGPIVYCLEAPDQPGVDLFRLELPRSAELRTTQRPDLLGCISVIQGEALADGKKPVAMMAIPFFAWGNRAKGAMTVWIQEVTKPAN